MKRFIILFISMIAACAISAQVSTQNYIRSRKMLDNVGNAYMDGISYFDGLGRLSLTVNKVVQSNVVKERMATLQEYDYYGRETKSWLPVPVTADYVEESTFRSLAMSSSGYSDTYPYSAPVYEASPLNRPLQQYGPGALWYNNNRAVKTEYLTNTTSSDLSCKLYTANTGSLSGGTAYYAANLLNVVKTTDEDLNVSYSFIDKLGRTILVRRMKDSEAHDTYYVYDDKGNLCFVLQPMYQSNANLDQYAFQYKYDGFNRCIWKKLPGAGYIEYTYDAADRLTFSQDGNQRAGNKWTYYLYDNLGRLTEQGECTNKSVASDKVVQIQNHYDDYAFVGGNGFTASQFTNDTSGYGKGTLTGSEIMILGSGTKIYTAHYYDVRGRETQTVQSNLLGGYEVTTTVYTFTDKPSTVTHVHTASGKTTLTEAYTYTYDHADRISRVEHTLNGAKVTLATMVYDNLGRLSSKSLHGSATNRQSYAYNIRNWLTGITGSGFTQSLYYNTGNGAARYNGNISSMTWKAGTESTVRGYKLTYDGLNRLTNAAYGETASISSNTNRFSENVTGYDRNGNITALQRYGQTSASAYGLIDNLTFSLAGNQLNRVDDGAGSSAYNSSFEFKDAVKQADEYAYDANGNLTKDLNKNITGIQYNFLDLPSLVTFADGSTIAYLYAADGTKLRTVHTIDGAATTTDYCGNVIYENGTQKLLLTEEGYVSLNDNRYHYYLKDHQGNNRVVINSAGTVEETNHYYPFGGVFESTSSVQPYKYNGKEFDAKKGLNWYDYGARRYDAALGRFTTIDPLAEKYSSTNPFAYCLNNPIKFIDPTGQFVSPIYDRNGRLLGTDDEGLKGKAIIMNKSNFKQGMSHEEALSYSLGYEGLIDNEARSSYTTSYTGLEDRPDYDGYLTLAEANKWYREGKGQPLFTSLDKIDLSKIYSLGEKYVGQIKSFNLLLHSGSLNDGLVYGNITLKRYPNHSVRAFSDKYDFEMHNFKNPANWGRNIETIIGGKVAGKGQPYEINIYGSTKLTPFLPWIK